MAPDPNLTEAFTIPVELISPLPRRLRLSGNAVFLLLVLALICFGETTALAPLCVTVPQRIREASALRAGARQADGTVQRVWYFRRSSAPSVSYTFIVDGKVYKGDSQAPSEMAHKLQQFGPITISYLSENPRINHPAAWQYSIWSDWGNILVPAVLTIVPVWLLTLLFRERQLLRFGTPTSGKVTSCYKGKNSYLLRYLFQTDDGTTRTGRGSSPDFIETGTTICVLYFPENPRRSISYPAPNFYPASLAPRGTDIQSLFHTPIPSIDADSNSKTR
ncbi:DUF3592 domain-containing protein [Acidicapsa dinghuensis]|uniref:DUF3592 domain-containing protein n=1 Tax=Acidicapsa dinghuensis TaxID=2218256 RepID=A0ABW1E8X9_9BACT|nr:DUF3592 domain-containing protein [Acidicapsa dinghuensis]